MRLRVVAVSLAPEVGVVPLGSGCSVLVVAEHRLRLRLELAPGPVVGRLEVSQRPRLVLEVTERDDRRRVLTLDDPGGRSLAAPAGFGRLSRRTRDVAGGRDLGPRARESAASRPGGSGCALRGPVASPRRRSRCRPTPARAGSMAMDARCSPQVLSSDVLFFGLVFFGGLGFRGLGRSSLGRSSLGCPGLGCSRLGRSSLGCPGLGAQRCRRRPRLTPGLGPQPSWPQTSFGPGRLGRQRSSRCRPTPARARSCRTHVRSPQVVSVAMSCHRRPSRRPCRSAVSSSDVLVVRGHVVDSDDHPATSLSTSLSMSWSMSWST